METEAVVPTTPESAPPPAPSIADHAAQFSPTRPEPTPDPTPTPVADTKPAEDKTPRQRSSKQEATPEDVPRIKELTRKWREEERQRQALEARIKELEGRLTPQAEGPKGEPTGEPKLEDFSTADDPYAEWILARQEYRAAQRQQAEQATAQQQAATQAEQQALEQYWDRARAFMETHPDFMDVVGSIQQEEPTPVIRQVLLTDDNAPAFVYHLAQHPDDRMQLHLLTDGRPVTDSLVAYTRRFLHSRLTAASTGAAVSAHPPVTAPRPPTPVRTGPMKTGDDPPGEPTSIAAHAKAFGPKRR